MIVHLKWRLVTILGLTAQVALASQRVVEQNTATVGRGTKAILFLSSCDSVEFHYSVLHSILSRLLNRPEKQDNRTSSTTTPFPVLRLHGNVPQSERTTVYRTFSESSSGLLIATDVAARGLDLPEVDLIIQADAPAETQDYVHRIGRTARKGSRGSAILLLQPHEQPYVELLQAAGLNIFVTDPSLPLASLARLPALLDLVAKPEDDGNDDAEDSDGDGDGNDERHSKGKKRRGATDTKRHGTSRATDNTDDSNVPLRKQYDPVTRVSMALTRMFEKARETRKRFGLSSAAVGNRTKDAPSNLSRVAEAYGQAWQYWLEEFVLYQTPTTVIKRPTKSKDQSSNEPDTVLQLARDAFTSFVRSYATHERSVRHIFNSRTLHLGHAAKAFGLREQPTKVGREARRFHERQEQGDAPQERDVKGIAKSGVMSAKTRLDLSRLEAAKKAKETEHPLSFRQNKNAGEKQVRKKTNVRPKKKVVISEFDA